MLISQRHQEIIDNAVDKNEWNFFAKRGDASPIPLVYKCFGLSDNKMVKMYDSSLPAISIWHGGFLEFYVHSDEFKENIKSAIDLLASYHRATKHLQKVITISKQAVTQAGFLYNNLNKLPDKELWAAYEKTIKYYLDSLRQGFVTWLMHPFQADALAIMDKYQDKLKDLNLDNKAVVALLAVSDIESVYFAKEKALDKLAIKYKNNDLQDKDVDDWLDKYQWVGYDYNSIDENNLSGECNIV